MLTACGSQVLPNLHKVPRAAQGSLHHEQPAWGLGHGAYHLKWLSALECISNIPKCVGNPLAWQGHPLLRPSVSAAVLAVPDSKLALWDSLPPIPLWDRPPQPFCMSWHKG